MESVSKKAVIYTRVATVLQGSKTNTLEIQKNQCKSFAAIKGITVMNSFSDIASGNESANGFEALLQYVSKQEIDYLIVYSKDRICRAPFIYKQIEKQLKRYKVEILPVILLEEVEAIN